MCKSEALLSTVLHTTDVLTFSHSSMAYKFSIVTSLLRLEETSSPAAYVRQAEQHLGYHVRGRHLLQEYQYEIHFCQADFVLTHSSMVASSVVHSSEVTI